MIGSKEMSWHEVQVRAAAQRQRQAPTLRSIADHIGVVEFAWAILAYFLFRFAFGGIALGILIGAVALIAVVRFQPAYYLKLRVLCWLPVVALLIFALSVTVMEGDFTQATYITWLIAALWLQVLGSSFFSTTSPQKARNIALIFLALLVPFALIPGLQDMGTVEPGVRTNLVLDDANAPRAFFFHSGELGMFTAALLVLVSTSHQFEGRANRTMEIATTLALTAVVVWSQSTSGLIIAVFAIVTRLLPWAPAVNWNTMLLRSLRKAIAFLPIVIVGLLALTQLTFPYYIENKLGAGSLWWRYYMADDITQHARPVDFSPHLISTLVSWPHSVFLDFLLMFGWAGVFLLLVEVALSWLLVRRGSAWPALFWAIAAVMPIGAGPVYLMLAAAFSYAHAANWRASNSPRQYRTQHRASRPALR